MTLMTASSLQPLHSVTANVRVGGSAPSALRARLDALIAAGVRCGAFLSTGQAETRHNQQQEEMGQLHSHR